MALLVLGKPSYPLFAPSIDEQSDKSNYILKRYTFACKQICKVVNRPFLLASCTLTISNKCITNFAFRLIKKPTITAKIWDTDISVLSLISKEKKFFLHISAISSHSSRAIPSLITHEALVFFKTYFELFHI